MSDGDENTKKVRKAVFNVFQAWRRGELNLAQYIIQSKKIKEWADNEGVPVGKPRGGG